MGRCYCGSGVDLADCCQPYLLGVRTAESPQKLMRSRYSAFVERNEAYLRRTAAGAAAAQPAGALPEVRWVKLQVVQASENGDHGQVEFRAYYLHKNQLHCLAEKSDFEKIAGLWHYVDGKLLPTRPEKIDRFAPCVCGSKLKFKNCCGAKAPL